MEFLDLPNEFHENDLRKALIRNMKDFILELGKVLMKNIRYRLVVMISELIYCFTIEDYSAL